MSLLSGGDGDDSGGLKVFALPPGESFFDVLAGRLLECHTALAAENDLSSLRVLVPALPMAVELRTALIRAAGGPLLLPCFDTLRNWVLGAPLPEIPNALPASERLVLLHEALRTKGWFDESALWGIASEMAALFDELTVASVRLPGSEEELAEQLQHAYALRNSAPLAFEARVVHESWRALAASGTSDAVAVYRLRLGALARQAEAGELTQPMLVLLDAPPGEALDAAELDFLRRCGAALPLHVFYPLPREAAATPVMDVLATAWPHDASMPLYGRARELAQRLPASPLAGRLRFVPASGSEQEAQAVVAQIGEWLRDGLRRIALIAQDRLTARRVRALLERENVLIGDETGWLLSTSRAAASVDALIETAAGNAYHRDLLDLCKSPFVFSDVEEVARKAAVSSLESAIRRGSAAGGLQHVRQCLLESSAAEKSQATALLDRIDAAMTLLRAKPAPLAAWIGRLHKALEAVGALGPLYGDTAGTALLDLLEKRREELASNTAIFPFAVWRNWLDREFEAASFRDNSIASTVVITPLNAVCLRRFEAAVLFGGDARQLAPAAHGEFFNQSVRRELGLRTRADGERELRRDLELLLATVPRVAVMWQSVQDGEANLPAPEFSLLATLHQLAWGDDLYRRPLAARPEAVPDAATAPCLAQPAAPIVPPALLPQRVSVSAYASLVACPYRFFARHVLRLGEMDEVSEDLDKSDYGALVHRVLERFHANCLVVSDLPREEALAALRACVTEAFAPAVAGNFLAAGWRMRWEKRLADYLEWQCGQEAQGWRWERAETSVSRLLPLDDGSVELYGRIDRMDRSVSTAAGAALFDYKTQTVKAIRDRLKDDVQLPAYALLHGHAAQAAYVALDDEKITAVAADGEGGDLMAAATAQEERLRRVFSAMRAGARLPAHGVDSVCQWCEMRGLCRKDHV